MPLTLHQPPSDSPHVLWRCAEAKAAIAATKSLATRAAKKEAADAAAAAQKAEQQLVGAA